MNAISAILCFLLVSAVSCRSRFAPTSNSLKKSFEYEFKNLLKSGQKLTVDQIQDLLEQSNKISNFGFISEIKDPEIAKVILDSIDTPSPSLVSELDQNLYMLSYLKGWDKSQFIAGSQEYKLAELYVDKIAAAVGDTGKWYLNSMTKLINNKHINIIKMLLDRGYPVSTELKCKDMLKLDEDMLTMFLPYGLDASQCGNTVMDSMQSQEFTTSKFKIFFQAGLPLDHEYYAWNWLEKALVVGRLDLAKCAYENGIKLSLYRLGNNHYDSFAVSPDSFAELLAEPSISKTVQSLTEVLRHKNGPFIDLPEDIFDEIKQQVHDTEVDEVKSNLFKP